MAQDSIADALFTKTQQKVLGLLFGKPDESFYTNEIMRRAAMGRGTVSRELKRLVDAGLLTMRSEGNQNHYQANNESPVYQELLSITRKTFGLADEIRQALEPVTGQVELGFIYGSLARGDDTKSSDIDLMLVGKELSFSSVLELLLPVEESLQRSINPTLMEKEEFIAKLDADSSFVTRVMEQSKIMIKGDEHGFGKTG